MEWLKEFLGDELYSQVEAKLKGNDKVKLANLASGEYVSKSKFDDKEKELATANDTIKQLKETAEKFDGSNIEKLREELKNTQTKHDAETRQLKEDMKKRDAVDAWLDAHPTKHRALMRSQFDYSKLTVGEDGKISGIEEIGKSLTESYSDMFVSNDEGDDTQSNPKDGGIDHGKSPQEKDPGKMSMEEYRAWREKQ